MSDEPITSDVIAGKVVVRPNQPHPHNPAVRNPQPPIPQPAKDFGSTVPESVIDRSSEFPDHSPQAGNQPINRHNETVQQSDEANRAGDAFHRAEAAKAALDKATSYTAYQQATPPVPEDLGAELAAIHQALALFAAKLKNRNHPGDMPINVALAEAHARIEAAKTSIQGA